MVLRPSFAPPTRCLICGTRHLSPRSTGDICPRCRKQKVAEQEVKVDPLTRKFQKKMAIKSPVFRRRYGYL